MQDPGAAPLGAREFARLMARIGVFEPAPTLAVAVSGGADSMALALLAAGWARRRGGAVQALTVDHGLRPGTRAEALLTGRRLKALGIPCTILTWRGAKPDTGIQAAARAARYGLLQGWCVRRGVLHLLLAHHLSDQAETLLLRLQSGSGADGLAAMAPVVETAGVRLVRPLLDVAPDRLRATLRRAGVQWVEDPSNRNTAHARVRLRRLLPVLASHGLDSARLAAAAREMAHARALMETETAHLLARATALYPAGYCVLDRAAIAAAPPRLAARALARVVTCIGGNPYPPGRRPVVRLLAAITAPGRFTGRTLAGCRLAPAGGGIIVCREQRPLGPGRLLVPGAVVEWDGRFRVRLAAMPGRSAGRFEVSALGTRGFSGLVQAAPEINHAKVPKIVRASLPAVRDGQGVICVPHLGFWRKTLVKGRDPMIKIAFVPPNGLAPTVFSVV